MQIMWKTLIFILAGYLGLCLVVFVFQRRMLYFPSQQKFSEASASHVGLRHWPSQGDFRGFINQGKQPGVVGTVIVFHGNAGSAFHRSFYTQALSKQNLRVILAEYPGYGGRDGRPSEAVLVADALSIIERAYQEFGGPLFLWGESLGCGIVSAALHQTELSIQGVVLMLPWDTLPNVAQRHYWYFPTRWLILDRYNNIKNLSGYNRRIAVLLAGDDEVVPVQHGVNLYESITTEKKLWTFEGARHNEVPIGPTLPWWGEVAAFITHED